MTPNEARVAIINRLAALPVLTAPEKDLNDNVTYKYAVDGDNKAWLRLTIELNDGSQETLGGSGVATKFDHAGLATVQVFTELGEGEMQNDILSDTVWREFVKQTGDKPLVYGGRNAGGDVRIVTVGRDGPWWQQNVVIPFWFERCVV